MAPDDELGRVREAIDEVDARILAALRERAALLLRVVAAKRAAGLPLFDPVREAAIVGRVDPGPVRDVYRALVERFRQAAVSGAFDGGGREDPEQR